MKILMVCLGNICRSPLAEGILQEKINLAGLPWVVDSAGTNGFHTGEAPHLLSQKIAALNGIDISHQKARNFIAADFEKYDKIYAMASDVLNEIKLISKNKFNADKIELLLNELNPGCNLDVADPWYGPEAGYHEVYELIEKACTAIVSKYAARQKQTSSAH
ncbi:MAG TPA: low molecular weight protein-tyrosine-phosphatase [Chitinophagaceae bacterium]|jgi:protein-tyrosine phosphatase|nr:low molecular weight protein-tyrosine-phosphatase [Chitinophagaceae bacterium]